MASQLHAPTLALGVGLGVATAVAASYLFKKEHKPAAAAATATPATAWPAGKPVFTDMSAYPAWDDSDKKASFMKINDMLMTEVRVGAAARAAVPSFRGLVS